MVGTVSARRLTGCDWGRNGEKQINNAPPQERYRLTHAKIEAMRSDRYLSDPFCGFVRLLAQSAYLGMTD